MKYEMLYLIDSAMAEEARDALIARFEETVKNLGGTVLSTDKWGVKKLAYLIGNKSDAFYVLMTFEADGSAIKELDRIAGITDGVLRRMISKAVN
ncbi:MAG TPA: 30S ribosomal protein S6 [Candidatus Borkfalkia stercoripullorum]|nr:30S ribosomal protein S6 [Candidatus Borkfalkia stercoripullorum]